MAILVLLFALIIGSFLNVCIYRIPKKESISFPPSHCPNCNTSLKPVDLVPVLSYIFLKGQCRYCGNGISIRYPVVEAINGFLWVMLYLRLGASISFIGMAILSSLLLVISIIDFDTTEIPDGLNLFGLVLGIIYIGIQWNMSILLSSAIGMVLGGGLFFLIAVASKGGMGGGDIKLMAVLGLWLGWRLTILVALLAFIIGAVISIALISLKIRGRKDYIPFGPFIGIGAYIAIVFGDSLINWYLKFFI